MPPDHHQPGSGSELPKQRKGSARAHAGCLLYLGSASLLFGILGLAAAVALALLLAYALSFLPTSPAVSWGTRCHFWLTWPTIALSAAAIVCGSLALLLGARMRLALPVRRIARAGIIAALIGILTAFLASLLSVGGLEYRHRARLDTCLRNITSMARSLQLYLADNDNAFPPAEEWCERLDPYLTGPKAFACPERPDLTCGYAFNSALGSLRYDALEDPEHTVAFFESDRGWNAKGGPELLPDSPRHFSKDTYGMVTGYGTYTYRQRMPTDARASRVWLKRPTREDTIRWELVVKQPEQRED